MIFLCDFDDMGRCDAARSDCICTPLCDVVRFPMGRPGVRENHDGHHQTARRLPIYGSLFRLLPFFFGFDLGLISAVDSVPVDATLPRRLPESSLSL